MTYVTTTRVLSHNVFWFQGVPFETDKPGAPYPGVPEGLARVHAEAGPDVICLQEVQSDEAFSAYRDAASLPGGYCPGRTLAQYGGAAYGAGCTATSDCHCQNGSISPEAVPQRVWHVCEFESGLRVANLHLPSSRQLGPEASARKRVAELARLLSPEAHPDGRLPDIVVGDFNERPGGAVHAFMQERGYGDSALLADKGDVSANVSGKGRGDFIWLTASLIPRLRKYDVVPKEVLAINGGADAPEGVKRYLSDHLPIWVELEM